MRSGFPACASKFGADMVYTEFISADALIRNVMEQKLTIHDEERPVAIQLYGRPMLCRKLPILPKKLIRNNRPEFWLFR